MAFPGRPAIPALTGLRFFLALFVVSFHQTVHGEMLGPEVLRAWPLLFGFMRCGYIAVGFFFLLSGFVLAYGCDLSERWTRGQRRKFWQARFARIYPVYLLALAVTFPFAIALRHSRPQLSWPVFFLTATLVLPLLQSWIPASAGIWNGPAWSLSNEAFFYLIFPVLARCIWKFSRTNVLLSIVLLLWLLNLTATTFLALHMAPEFAQAHGQDLPVDTAWANFIKFNPLLHIVEFVSGIAIARIYLETLKHSGRLLRPGKGAWLYAPAMVCELLLLLFAEKLPYALVHDGLLMPVHATIVLGLALGGPGVPQWLAFQPFVFLGQSSYALYLLHVGVWKWIHACSRHFSHVPIGSPSFFFAYATFCIFISCLVFEYVEEPARKLLLWYFSANYRLDRKIITVSMDVGHEVARVSESRNSGTS